MGQDDDADCVEHVWRLTEALFKSDGGYASYSCERCDAGLLIGPGGVHPETA